MPRLNTEKKPSTVLVWAEPRTYSLDPATVLLREIRKRGYEGGISQLKAYLAPFKATKLDPVVRFETAPGDQMQADFTTIRRVAVR